MKISKGLQALAFLVTCATLLYVARLHLAGALAPGPSPVASELVDLRGPTLPRSLGVDARGGLDARPSRDGVVLGGNPPGPAEVRLLATRRTLAPSMIVRGVVRVTRDPRVEVGVGLVAEGEGGERAITVALSPGAPEPTFTVDGDRAAAGPREPVRRVLRGGETRVGEIGEGSHELALRVELDAGVVVPIFDGQPLPPVPVRWIAGVRVRPVLFVRAEGAGAPVAVVASELEARELPRTLSAPAVDERFDGRTLDPARWTVLLAREGEVLAEPGGGQGLLLRGRAGHARGFLPAVAIRGGAFLLSSFRLRARVEIASLDKSALVFGLFAEWQLPWSFEIAVVPAASGGLELLVAGQFGGDGAGRVEPLGVTFPRVGELGLDYDSARGTMRVQVDGKNVAEKRPDLLPGEEVRLRFGANFQEEGGAFEARLRSVQVSP